MWHGEGVGFGDLVLDETAEDLLDLDDEDVLVFDEVL